ncbi:MAG: hypothetical protein P1U65_07040 [Minwuia sp.]|nr:hypothetical protein [Minwuia sp.]
MKRRTGHKASAADIRFRDDFAAFRIDPAEFRHRQHIRLAYVCLVNHGPDAATAHVRDTITALLHHIGVDPAAKYHETMTRAWVLAVDHFMHRDATPATSADAFIDANPRLLDKDIMLTHYAHETLFSDNARAGFVAPDRAPIPLHA